MIEELENLWSKIKYNKKAKKGECSECPLRFEKYIGPLLIEQEGNKQPRIVFISESPARCKKESEYGMQEIKKRWCKEWSEISIENRKWQGEMSKFLAEITRKKMMKIGVDYFTTIPEFYWTHSIKCFIQLGKEGLRQRKKKLGKEFGLAFECCKTYLKKEMELLKPELVITIGEKAYEGFSVPKFQKAVITKCKIIKFPIVQNELKCVVLYHPGAQIKKEKKVKKYDFTKKEIEKILEKKNGVSSQ